MPLRGTQNPMKMGLGSFMLRLRPWRRIEAVFVSGALEPAHESGPDVRRTRTWSPRTRGARRVACPLLSPVLRGKGVRESLCGSGNRGAAWSSGSSSEWGFGVLCAISEPKFSG